MPRLPEPGKDSGQWGDILNQYLRVVHDVDGSIKPGIISSVGLSGLYADLINKPTIPSTIVLFVKLGLNIPSFVRRTAIEFFGMLLAGSVKT